MTNSKKENGEYVQHKESNTEKTNENEKEKTKTKKTNEISENQKTDNATNRDANPVLNLKYRWGYLRMGGYLINFLGGLCNI